MEKLTAAPWVMGTAREDTASVSAASYHCGVCWGLFAAAAPELNAGKGTTSHLCGSQKHQSKQAFSFEDDTKVKHEGPHAFPRATRGGTTPPRLYRPFSGEEIKAAALRGGGACLREDCAAPPPLSPDQSEKVSLLLATRTSSATLKTPDLMKLSSR